MAKTLVSEISNMLGAYIRCAARAEANPDDANAV